jgi:hypothetical protein
MKRLCVAWVLAASLSPQLASAESARESMLAFADLDDDDDDGRADALADAVSGRVASDVLWFGTRRVQAERLDSPVARFIAGTRPWSGGGLSPGRLGVQGLAAGRAVLELDSLQHVLSVIQVLALDGRDARVDLARSHAAISRSLPHFLGAESDARAQDPDALRWVLAGPIEALPDEASLLSTRPDGTPLDRLDRIELVATRCPAGLPPSINCRTTALIRATVDPIDRQHPESSARSLRGEVGGRMTLMVGALKAASIRVGGPRATALGPIERLRARLRMHVLRSSRGGMPAIGGDDAGARELARQEVDSASGLWGQCGIHFGVGSEIPVFVRDPPPPYLLAVGCELGMPASGGEVRLLAGGRRVRLTTRAGQSPADVAAELARALTSAGLVATVSPNPLTGPSARRTVDVLVRRADGSLAELRADGAGPLSSDASLQVCLGEVELADGLSHFTDADAPAGTIEERALVKAYDDGDPTTIDVFVVPSFAGAGRIGESFIDTPGSSIQNVIILDRAAIRSGARSFALAHELGHILLELPGHPDDFGVDLPSALMDADAADPSIFGPRRLSLAECERALRESGPTAPVPLLEPWPLTGASGAVPQRAPSKKR